MSLRKILKTAVKATLAPITIPVKLVRDTHDFVTGKNPLYLPDEYGQEHDSHPFPKADDAVTTEKSD
jgi:hypothetical protein